jgi:F0F1-type ATP synthase membrane subunit c/vacuolar-type H+-ATPase subunit K
LSAFEIALALAAGLGMAIISWRFVETPLRKAITPSEFKRVFLPMAICSSIVLLGLGTGFHTLDGMPTRMDTASLAMLDQFQKNASLDCMNNQNTGRYGRECDFGAPDAVGPSIMLWGDSHARHYLPAIAKIATAQGIKGLARFRDACRPFIAPEGLMASAKRRVCRKLNEEALAKLSARPDISVVVLAARWSSQESVSGDMNELELFSQNLGKTITALEQIGKKVIVLGQVPKLPLELKSCMTKQVRFSQKIPNCEAVPLSILSNYETDIWTMMRTLSQEYSKATFFAPQNHLCDGSICRATDEKGLPLYSDDDHLSARGAYFLEPHMGEAIGQFVRSSPPQIIETRHP